MYNAQNSGPVYGWYGDDFTGATDTLATLAMRGVSAFLFLAPPDHTLLAKAGAVEAIGIAGAARSMTPEAMRNELKPVGEFFAANGVSLIHYKCCSTFDSAPQTGNLAVAMDTLKNTIPSHLSVVIGGQPSLRRFCVFGNLFASGGNGGEIWRLDRHPTMSRHPATPMTEADLRRHFETLGLDDLKLVPWTSLVSGEGIDREVAASPLLFDVLEARHIEVIGGLLRQQSLQKPVLAMGASSVAEAFFHDRPIIPAGRPQTAEGPVLAIAGSLSPLSAKQVAAATEYQRIVVSPADLMSSESAQALIAGNVCKLLREGKNVLVSTSSDNPEEKATADTALAKATARLVTRIIDEVPVNRLAVAGGDTSSHVAQNLGLWGLSYGWQHSPGVTVSTGRSNDAQRDGLQMMLKGGQMGEEDIFNSFAWGEQQRSAAE